MAQSEPTSIPWAPPMRESRVDGGLCVRWIRAPLRCHQRKMNSITTKKKHHGVYVYIGTSSGLILVLCETLGPWSHGPMGPWAHGPMGPWAMGPWAHRPMGNAQGVCQVVGVIVRGLVSVGALTRQRTTSSRKAIMGPLSLPHGTIQLSWLIGPHGPHGPHGPRFSILN